MSELGNEAWEFLFGELKGDVPDCLTEDVLASLAGAVISASEALRSTPVDAEPISWLSFNDGSEPYLTGNQAEMIKLEATGPGPHALYARPLPNPSLSDGEVSEAFRNVDDSDWKHLFAVLPDTGRGRFWKAVMAEAQTALHSSKRGRP